MPWCLLLRRATRRPQAPIPPAGLLGGPLPGRVQGDAEDADAPGRVLDHGQDIGLGAVEQADAEEVACEDRLGLGAQELLPGRAVCRSGAGSTPLGTMSRCQRRIVSGVASSAGPGGAPSVSRPPGPRAAPGPATPAWDGPPTGAAGRPSARCKS